MMERLYHTCVFCGGLCCSDGGRCPAVMERLYHTCLLCGGLCCSDGGRCPAVMEPPLRGSVL